MTAATSLQASLEDVALDDVLRLLAARRRTGLLVVNPPSPQWLVLADGSIVFGGATSPLALGRQLLASGVVSAQQLETLLGLVEDRRGERAARQFGDADVLGALANVVPLPELTFAVRRQAVATVFEMMVMSNAELVFNERPEHPLADRFRIPMDEVIDAAAEQAATWHEVSARVGGDATRLRRVRRLGVAATPVILDATEWAALSEIDDRSTVGQIAHRLGLGRHDASVVLGGLLDRGVVEAAGT